MHAGSLAIPIVLASCMLQSSGKHFLAHILIIFISYTVQKSNVISCNAQVANGVNHTVKNKVC